MVTYFDNWQEVPLSEVADVRDGTHDSPQYVSYGYPLVTSKNLKNGKIDWSDIQYISQKDFDAINKRSKVDLNDILMGMIGTIGNIAMIHNKCNFAIKNVALIKDVQKANMIYLYYYLQSKNATDQLADQADGGNQKFIALNKIRNFVTLLPSLPEQGCIAKTLACFDSYIDNLTELIEKKRNIRDGALEDLVSGRTRLDGYVKCLIEKTLGSISNIQDGTHGTFKRTSSGFYLLSAKNVFNNHLLLGEDESKVSEQDYLRIVANGYPQKGDILLSCVGTIGRCCLLEIDKAAFQRSVAFIRVNDIDKKYLLYVLQSKEIQKQLLGMVNASAQGGIYLGSLNKLKLRVTMNKQEQIAISSILQTMDEEIETLENERDKIIQIRDGAMDDLLTGRVRLKV